jgi:hypothetical protein
VVGNGDGRFSQRNKGKATLLRSPLEDPPWDVEFLVTKVEFSTFFAILQFLELV